MVHLIKLATVKFYLKVSSFIGQVFKKKFFNLQNRMEYVKKCAEEVAVEFEKMSSASKYTGTPSNRSLYSNSPQTPATSNYCSDVNSPTRSSFIQRRLEKLSRYGEAPPLSPITLQSSTRVKSEFVPHQRTPTSK